MSIDAIPLIDTNHERIEMPYAISSIVVAAICVLVMFCTGPLLGQWLGSVYNSCLITVLCGLALGLIASSPAVADGWKWLWSLAAAGLCVFWTVYWLFRRYLRC